jgi:aryl-alcohol dehydrogenase-like predicted oxidoreductase
MPKAIRFDRRAFIAGSAALGASALAPHGLRAERPEIDLRPIPSSGARIPAVGMGTWITFNVGEDTEARRQRADVLQRFFAMGGGMVDSSPMYGSSEAVIGWCLDRLQAEGRDTSGLFSATKVWTRMFASGQEQMDESRALWGLETFDLMQVHNLVDWQTHLPALKDDKAAGRIRYLGITTSHGRRHEEFERIMASEPLDFVQFTYNILDREVERRLLPLAADRGQAVIVNRPFRTGGLFDRFAHHPLPDFAAEIEATDWAQFLLKFILSHPAVTCAIPATRRVGHMQQNMGALTGPLPDAALRRRMIDYAESL